MGHNRNNTTKISVRIPNDVYDIIKSYDSSVSECVLLGLQLLIGMQQGSGPTTSADTGPTALESGPTALESGPTIEVDTKSGPTAYGNSGPTTVVRPDEELSSPQIPTWGKLWKRRTQK